MNLNKWADWLEVGRLSEWCVLARASCWRGCKESIRRLTGNAEAILSRGFRLPIDYFMISVYNITPPPTSFPFIETSQFNKKILFLISYFLCFHCVLKWVSIESLNAGSSGIHLYAGI